MVKKFLLSILLCCLSVSMLFASGSSESKDSGEKVYKVAYIARAQADSFAAWLANSVKAEAEKYPNIELSVFDGQASDDIENSMIENAITNQFDCIIIQPNNGESQRPYAEKVVQAGIKCITTNARISGIDGASSVDADPYEQAAVNARVAVTQIPKNANVVVLLGPSRKLPCRSKKNFLAKRIF